jgi:hypothetical protein
MTPILTKSFKAGAAIAASRFIKMGAADWAAIQAADAAAPILGVSAPNVAAATDQSVDVVMDGIALVECGGVVTRGQFVEADANGKAVNANIVAGALKYVGGIALETGAAGELVPVRVQPTVIGADGVAEVEITLTTAQVKALNATPIDLVAAPGAGKVLILEGAQRAFYDFVAAAYAGIAAGEDLTIKYTDGSGAVAATFETTGFLDQVADQHRIVYPSGVTPVANAKLVAHMATGEIITGDGPVKIKVRYRSVDMQA